MQTLAKFLFGISGLDASVDLRGDLSDYARGSRNLMPDGLKMSRPFRGLTSAGAGSRQMFQMKNSFGGLDDILGEPARGSLFSTVADMLVYIGKGQVKVEHDSIPGAEASGVLRFLLKWNGSYTHANSGPYAAGLPEPAAPQVGAVSDSTYGSLAFTNAALSIKYARLRTATGGRSRASASSAVVVFTSAARAIFVVVPEAIAGQNRHIFFGINPKLSLGLHYRIARANPFTGTEYTEEDVQRTVQLTGTTAPNILTSLGKFTAGDIGKRVAPVSGFTVPAGTIITEILSDNQVKISNPFTLTTGALSCELIAFAGGIDRSVILSYTASDLVEETAWIYDFPPPSGSHAFQLENRMFVVSGADANADAGADNPGTVLTPSIPNHFESYDPRFPVFLPEAVVDILSDGMESYKFIGGRNGIYAAQYLNVERAAPLTLSVLLRGEGIETPGNWCARERAIYLFTGKGQPVRIVEGGRVDTSFGVKIRPLMRDWAQADTVVSAHPGGGGVVYSNGRESYFFDEATERWSAALDISDFAAGEIISSVSTQSELLITLSDGAARTAYRFDQGAGSFVCGISQYQDQPNPRGQKIIQRIEASGVMDRIDKTGYVALHVNTLPTHFIAVATVNNSNQITVPGAAFSPEYIGSFILIRKAGATGKPLLARIGAVISATQVTLVSPNGIFSAAAPLNCSATLASTYALFGLRIFPFRAMRTGTIEIDSGEIELNGVSSYAASWMSETSGINAQPLDIAISGTPNNEEGWTLPSAVFGESL